MVLIANLQYGWTLFVNPINKAHGWSLASIQFAFWIFIALETWLTPIEGWIVDTLGARRGPKLMVAFGGIMVALGWVINAYAQSLEMLYLGAVVGGSGGGAVYATCVGQAVKWFPDRRGLAVGLTAAGYGAGSALSVIPIRAVMNSAGYEAAFFWFGLVQGGIVFVLAWLFRAPDPGETAGVGTPKVAQTSRNYTPLEALSTPVFWLLYLMFVMVSASGLMATAQIAPIADDSKVAAAGCWFGAPRRRGGWSVAKSVKGGGRRWLGGCSDQIGGGSTRGTASGRGGSGNGLFGRSGPHRGGSGYLGGPTSPTSGGNSRPVPAASHRHVRHQVGHGQSRPAYYGQGGTAVPGAVGNLIQAAYRRWPRGFVITAISSYVVVGAVVLVVLPLRQRGMVARGGGAGRSLGPGGGWGPDPRGVVAGSPNPRVGGPEGRETPDRMRRGDRTACGIGRKFATHR